MFENFSLTLLNPWCLLLLPIVIILCWVFFKKYQPRSMWNELCDAHLLKVLVPTSVKSAPGHSLIWVLLIVLCLMIIAASGPSWRSQAVPLFESNDATVVVLDLSQSMMAQDVQPTRFKRALYKARDLINLNVDGQVALVAFAGAAFVVSPLTDDKETLLNFLVSLRPEIMPVQGSRVDLGITVAQKILSNSASQSRRVILLTDGASDVNAAIKSAKEAVKKSIVVSILAIGTQQGGPIKDASDRLVRDQAGELVIAKINFEELNQIANAGNGLLVKMTASNQDINHLRLDNRVLSSDRATESADRTLELPINDGVWLVWLILPLALMLFRKNALWLIAVVHILPINQNIAYAFEWQSLWRNSENRAYEAYQNSEYDKAIQLSKDPQIKGSAYYKDEDYQNAQQMFSSQANALSFYNRGNALAYQEQFDKAIEAYNQSLELDPQYELTLQNKQLVEEFLKQQQSEQNNQQNQNEKGEESSEDQSDGNESEQSESDQSSQANNSQADNLQSDSTDETQQDQTKAEPESDPEQPTQDQQIAKADKPADEHSDPESIERWINRLPDDPSEILRRKFLRDYQRQRTQP